MSMSVETSSIKYTNLEKCISPELLVKFKRFCKESDLDALFSPEGLITIIKVESVKDEKMSFKKDGDTTSMIIKHRMAYCKNIENEVQGVFYMVFTSTKFYLTKITPDGVEGLIISKWDILFTVDDYKILLGFTKFIPTLSNQDHKRSKDYSFNPKILEGYMKEFVLLSFLKDNRDVLESLKENLNPLQI